MRTMARVGAVLMFSAGTMAEAKDLPRLEPAHHATGCEWAGPGYVKAEGSDTCVRVAGSVRAEFSISSNRKPAYLPGAPDD